MADWDDIKTEFGGDETAAFGPRKETGSALYQIDTVATIACRDQGNTVVPTAASSVLGDVTCLAVDKNLVLNTSSILSLESAVEVVEWSPDCSLVVLGLNGGRMYVLDAETTEIIFSMNLVSHDRHVGGKAFRSIIFTATLHLVILTADGQLIVQPDVQLHKSESGDLQNMITDNLMLANTKPYHSHVYDMVVHNRNIYTLGGGDSTICVWNFSDGSLVLVDETGSFLENDSELMCGKITTDGHYIFAIDSDHHICVLDAVMLICVKRYTGLKVENICLLETNTSQNNNMEDMKLVLVTRPRPGGVCTVQVRSLPAWETVYDLQLSAPTYLSSCNTFQDALYLIEFCATEGLPGTVSTVRYRRLSETDPKTRLYRILQKNKFEEAENFANLFHLDIEIVHKVKANYIIDQLSPWNVELYSKQEVEDKLSQLWVCLDTIVDDVHTAETCMRAFLPTFKDTNRLLTYCKARLDKCSSSKEVAVTEKQPNLYSKLLEIKRRLLTFKLAYGEHSFTGDLWQQFIHADIMKEALGLLEQGQFPPAFIIWNRHQCNWSAERMSGPLIQKILSLLHFHKVPSSDLQDYLSSGLIPAVVRLAPHTLIDIIDFVIEIAKSMETKDKDHWPLNAIGFASKLHAQLQDATSPMTEEDTCMAEDSAHKTQVNAEEILSPLATLIVKLRQLDNVIHKYKCRLSLSQFLKETEESIVFRMLDKVVALELISQTLERQIRPYIAEHGLNQNQIFSKYIMDLLERYSQVQSFGADIAWEAKAAAVMDCISDIEQKINGVLAIIQWAPIPWSSRVESIVQSGLQLKHCKVHCIQDKVKQVSVRKVLMKYGLKNVEVPQDAASVEHLVNVMLTQDLPGCIENCLEIIKYTDLDIKDRMYTFRMRQYIEMDRLDEGLQLVETLTSDLGVKVARSIVGLTDVILTETVMISQLDDKYKKQKRLYTEAAIHLLKYLQTKEKNHIELLDLQTEEALYIKLRALQTEFGEYMSLDEYRDEESRELVMDTYFLKYHQALVQETGALTSVQLYRLADILQVSRIALQGQLAIKLATDGHIDTAVQICRDLYEASVTPSLAATMIDVVRVLLQLQAEVDPDSDIVDCNKLRLLPDVCHCLASKALCICESGLELCEYLEVARICSLQLAVSRQCEAGEDSLSLEWGVVHESQTDEEWSGLNLDVFSEDALIMTSGTAIPLVARYAVQNPLIFDTQSGDDEKSKGDGATPHIERLCASVVPIVQHLRGNSHLQLAHTFSLHMLSTMLQHVQQLYIGDRDQAEDDKDVHAANWKAFTELNNTSQVMLKDLTFTLVMKIFNSSRVDSHLAFMFLCNRPKREVMDVMMRLTKSAGQQYKKLRAIAGLGICLGQALQEPTMISSCQELENNASWGYRLSKMKISFKDAILSPNSEKTKLLPAIAQNHAADTELVREFCRSFKLDEDEGLLLYLDHLFVAPDDGARDLDARMAVIARAQGAIAKIKNKDELLFKIKKIYMRTSAYDYESLRFTLETIKKQAGTDLEDIPIDKGLKLLDYLKVYSRVSPPSDYETEFKMGGDKKEAQIFLSPMPAESQTRLPLHPLLHGDPWKIITPELRKDTLDTWLHTAQLLTLSPDQICLLTLHNMVNVYTETFTSPDGGSNMSQWHWKPEQVNQRLLQDLMHIVKSNKNIENSLACAKWMVNKLPLGSEKVLVLKYCITLAELWHHSIPEKSAKRDKAMQAYLKFKGHWQKMASAQALCLNGLGESDLLQMTDKPTQLIQRLYEHPSITTATWASSDEKPDIHSAAQKVAEINNIRLDLIQHSLIEKWLQSGVQAAQETDTTMTFSLENLKMTAETLMDDKTSNEEENFKRIIHLVQRENRESNLLKLFDFALQPKEGRDTGCCILALRCLLHLCDNDTMIKECNKSLDDIRKLMYVMIYLSGLERLHIRHTVDTFISCQKEALVRGLWKNHSHEKSAVSLVSSLCLDYNIYDLQLWTSILQRLHSFGLIRQLEYILLRLNNVPELWQIPAFPKMWFTVISTSLLKVSAPLSKEQTDATVHAFNQLLSCPVLDDIDGESLSRMYQRLELPALALGCLLLSGQPESVKIFASQYGKETMANLLTLHTVNGLNKGLVNKISDVLYGGILESSSFHLVLGTVHQKAFVSYCIGQRNIDTLLGFALQNGMVLEAQGLVTIYVNKYTDITMRIAKYIDVDEEEQNQGLTTLKAYLMMQKMHDALATLTN